MGRRLLLAAAVMVVLAAAPVGATEQPASKGGSVPEGPATPSSLGVPTATPSRSPRSSTPGPASSMTTAINADGRLEVARFNGTILEHAWQLSPGGGWSPWEALPGPVGALEPTMIQNSDGRLEVFVAATGGSLGSGVVHSWQLTPGGGWSSWELLAPGAYIGPNVGRNQDGRLQVFLQEDTNEPLTIMTMAQQCAGCGWGQLAPLSTPPVSASWGFLTVWLDRNALLNVVSWSTPNGGLWFRQTAPNAGFAPQPLSVPALPVGFPAGPLGAAMNSDGTMQLFVVGSDRNLWTIRQFAPGGEFVLWLSLGGDFPTEFNSVLAAANVDGRLEVFVTGFANGATSHVWQTSPGGSFTPAWTAIKGTLDQPDAQAAIQNADGRLEIFVANLFGVVFNAYQMAPATGPWSSLARLN
ncbi:MAG: hypothetical protein HYX32_13840 [Actinobacteria bacterium]|nr:hypothetical protein [Actinomycetota bacterium]